MYISKNEQTKILQFFLCGQTLVNIWNHSVFEKFRDRLKIAFLILSEFKGIR